MAAVAASAVALAGGTDAAQPARKAAPAPPPPAPGQPIIPDDQFQKELPPLDPDLAKPLEPIDAFKGPDGKPLTAPIVAPNGTLPPVTAPADPALTEPLAPLSTFDVTTPPPPAKEGVDDQAKVEPVRYTLVVEGLKEVGLEGRFRSLSALEDADGKATNGAMVSARAREDELLAVRLLRSEGYYDATALSSIEQLPETPGQLRVVVTTVPGARYSLGAIAIQGPETVPAGLPREALPLKSGDPIVAAEVEAAEANVRLRLPQQGYPFADVGLRDIMLDPDSRRGDYTLPVDPGPRSRFAGFTTEGKLAFDAHHVGVLSRFKRGELYDSRKVDDLREAMIATSLFRTVAAEPVATGEFAPDGAEYVNIRVRQEAGPARSINGTAGYSTGEGLRIEGTWEHRNFFPPEGGLRVAAVAGTPEQALRGALHKMNAGKSDRPILIEAGAGRRALPALKGYPVRLHGVVSRESTPIWQKVWTWAYGAELIATNENETRFPPISLKDAYLLAGLTGQLGYDRSNSLLDPTKGFRILGRLNPETSLRDPTQPYLRSSLEGRVYVPAGKSLTVAGRAMAGSVYGAALSELAPSRRLYGGGGGSVRGFGFQQLGPKIEIANPKFDPTDPKEKDKPTILVPTGGRSQVEFALEGRYRFGNYGVVAFVDAGQVYQSETPRFTDMRYGVGVGGRFYTNFGPLRADIAMPIGRRKGESRFAVYVSIGQAF